MTFFSAIRLGTLAAIVYLHNLRAFLQSLEIRMLKRASNIDQGAHRSTIQAMPAKSVTANTLRDPAK